MATAQRPARIIDRMLLMALRMVFNLCSRSMLRQRGEVDRQDQKQAWRWLSHLSKEIRSNAYASRDLETSNASQRESR